MNQQLMPYQGALQPSTLPADTTDDRFIALWLDGKKSVHTQEAYERDIRQFLAFIGHKPLQLVNLADLRAYEKSMQGKPATRNRKVAAVKGLLTFGHETGYLALNVGKAVKLDKVNRGLAQRILSVEQVIKMISLEPNKRNHALLRLLYHCGLRVSEVISLEWDVLVDRNGKGQLTVIGKGNKERTIMIEADMWHELMALKAQATGPEVFTSRGNGRGKDRKLSRAQVWQIVHRAAKRAGIAKPVSPHWFRHAHASHSLNQGAPISLVKETLGHETLATTGLYTHAMPEQSSSKYLSM